MKPQILRGLRFLFSLLAAAVSPLLFSRVACGPAGVLGAACTLLGRAAVCAGGRRPAREIATREPAARSGRSRGPPWPCRRPPAPRPGPPVPPAPSTPVGLGRCCLVRCVVSKPGQAPPPPMGAAAWPCRPGVRLSETAIAFAHSCSCGIETPVAYAGAKWVFLVQCSGAEVMSVSVVPCWGRAVVLLVSTSPCCRASCAKKFALLGLVWVRARKSSPCTLKTPQNRRFFACWANFFAEEPLEGLCWESFSRQSALSPGLVGDVAREAGCGGGFAALEAGWRRVAGVSFL